MLLTVIGGEVVERKAREERGMIYKADNSPLLLKADVLLINVFLSGTIENREDAGPRRLVEQR